MTNELSALLRENVTHKTHDYQLAFYVCNIPETYRYLPAHWHDEFEIALIEKGELHYVIGPHDLTVKKGDILLMPPGILHSAHQIDDVTAKTHSIVFHLKLTGLEIADRCTEHYIQPLQDLSFQPVPVIHTDHPMYEEILACFEEVWDCQNRKKGTGLLLKASLYRLLYYIWQMDQTPVPEPTDHETLTYAERIKPVLAYIQSHYAEVMTIEDLAAQCGFSQVHFMNVFKKVIGTTCVEYIIEYRLTMAIIDLKESNKSIMKIAMDHGFQNISYFNRTFRRKFDMTPTQYRKTHRTK